MTEDRLTALYRTYGPSLYARCLHILGDAAAAEDATQDTFMRLHRQLERADTPEQALAWVWRVATNYCLNQVRNRQRQAEPVAQLPEAAGEHEEGWLSDRDLVRRLVTRAPPQLAEVAWLHHADGLTQEEVAQVLGISRRTVVNRLSAFQQHARTLTGSRQP